MSKVLVPYEDFLPVTMFAFSPEKELLGEFLFLLFGLDLPHCIRPEHDFIVSGNDFTSDSIDKAEVDPLEDFIFADDGQSQFHHQITKSQSEIVRAESLGFALVVLEPPVTRTCLRQRSLFHVEGDDTAQVVHHHFCARLEQARHFQFLLFEHEFFGFPSLE